MQLSRRRFIQALVAGGAALALPKCEPPTIVADDEELRRFWALDRAMLRPRLERLEDHLHTEMAYDMRVLAPEGGVYLIQNGGFDTVDLTAYGDGGLRRTITVPAHTTRILAAERFVGAARIGADGLAYPAAPDEHLHGLVAPRGVDVTLLDMGLDKHRRV